MLLFVIIFIFTTLYSYLFITNSQFFWPIWIVISLVLGVLSMILIIIALIPLMKILKPNHRFKHWFIRQIAQFATLVVGIRITTEGKENIPDSPFVVYANHKSYCDILIAFQLFKTPISFVSKPGVFRVPVLSSYMKSINCISFDRENDREAAKAMIKAIQQVKSGYSMMIFPEGGIIDINTDNMVQIKPGAYKLAMKSDAPIVPVSMRNTILIRKRAPFRLTRVFVKIHNPIFKEEYNMQNTIDIGEKVYETVNQELEKK